MSVVEDLKTLSSLLSKFKIENLTVYLNKYDFHEARQNVGVNIIYPIMSNTKTVGSGEINSHWPTFPTGTLHIKSEKV